jgi:hypothetical protein
MEEYAIFEEIIIISYLPIYGCFSSQLVLVLKTYWITEVNVVRNGKVTASCRQAHGI